LVVLVFGERGLAPWRRNSPKGRISAPWLGYFIQAEWDRENRKERREKSWGRSVERNTIGRVYEWKKNKWGEKKGEQS